MTTHSLGGMIGLLNEVSQPLRGVKHGCRCHDGVRWQRVFSPMTATVVFSILDSRLTARTTRRAGLVVQHHGAISNVIVENFECADQYRCGGLTRQAFAAKQTTDMDGV
tara:strand:- start:14709 stop:15035 length:327 start_codon:yes stop_codon:yes gene_type:complete